MGGFVLTMLHVLHRSTSCSTRGFLRELLQSTLLHTLLRMLLHDASREGMHVVATRMQRQSDATGNAVRIAQARASGIGKQRQSVTILRRCLTKVESCFCVAAGLSVCAAVRNE